MSTFQCLTDGCGWEGFYEWNGHEWVGGPVRDENEGFPVYLCPMCDGEVDECTDGTLRVEDLRN